MCTSTYTKTTRTTRCDFLKKKRAAMAIVPSSKTKQKIHGTCCYWIAYGNIEIHAVTFLFFFKIRVWRHFVREWGVHPHQYCYAFSWYNGHSSLVLLWSLSRVNKCDRRQLMYVHMWRIPCGRCLLITWILWHYSITLSIFSLQYVHCTKLCIWSWSIWTTLFGKRIQQKIFFEY